MVVGFAIPTLRLPISLYNQQGDEEEMVRKYTDKLIDMLSEGLVRKDYVIIACLKYMSEDDVKDMMEKSEIVCPCHGNSYCEGE